ncbi:protransforming growth factor alpha-like [Polypterus senegalus]|uniref:protransforming growth factor alpha-like n=1 Tax=Polypterus senegalus TaxID=55291 RepID=UPI001963C729|nr:protransforming growth factor alpha-like [Polypterus senegalus]
MLRRVLCSVGVLIAFTVSSSSSGSSEFFLDCPEKYNGYCHQGTCRFIISEDVASCICNEGYTGHRCQHSDLLSIFSNNPDSMVGVIAAVILVAVLAVLLTTCICLYSCKRRINCRLSLQEEPDTPYEHLEV